MVDKRSLRSSKSNESNSDANKKSSTSSNSKAQPTRSSSRKASGTSQAAKRASDKPAPAPTSAPAQKKDPATEDVEMADSSAPAGEKPAKDADKKDQPAKASGEDVEMKDETAKDEKKDEKKEGEEEKEKEDPVTATVNVIKQNYTLLERAVATFDARFTLKVLRGIASLRRKATPEILGRVINDTYPSDHASSKLLLEVIGQPVTDVEMEVDGETGRKSPSGDVLPEVDIYLHLLVQIYLLDQKSYEAGAKFSDSLVKRIHSLNRRTLDSLAAKVYFYYSRFYELVPSVAVSAIRTQLLASLRTATLRKDIDTQATLITLLLRNYLLTSHIAQADQLVSKAVFPEGSAANNLTARYHYYLGKIKAIQLEYSDAHAQLLAATRKAPQGPAATGFLQAATKLNVVVQLLMGDIPERSTFREDKLQKALHPYFLLVQAVRVGELDSFFETLRSHEETFKKDGTYSLVLRLRQNVIKTGIRMMSLTYSKISLKDICMRLRLDSEESAEYIVAKAIRDGVIEAVLDHEKGFMQSKEILDVYSTQEPQEQFHERIGFCMTLHNDSVKAMRFPMNQHRLELKNAQEARERERELAKEIQDGDIDEDDAGGEFEGL